MQIGRLLLLALGLLATSVAPSKADEVFLCEDDSLLYVDSSNRNIMYAHPCVQAWFEMDAALRAGCRDAPEGCSIPSRWIGAQRTALHALVRRSYELSRAARAGSTVQPSVALRYAIPRFAARDHTHRTVFVRQFTRKDGTYVRAHYRSPPHYSSSGGHTRHR